MNISKVYTRTGDAGQTLYESSVSHFLTNNNTTVTYDSKYVPSTFFNS